MLRATRRMIVLAAVVLCLGSATACSDGGGSAPDGESGAPTSAPAPIAVNEEAPATSAPQLGAVTSDIACGDVATWNVAGQADNFPDLFSGDVVADVVANPGDACEEIRFVLSGPSPAGYSIEYGRAWDDENGATVEVAGAATLIVILNAPLGGNGDASDRSSFGLRADYFRGWSSLRELKHTSHTDGGSVWAVGTQDQRPFKAHVEPGQGNAWTLVLQVAA